MQSNAAFKVRGIETHTRHMWEWDYVKRMIDFAGENDLNTLVFHQNDLLDQILCPESYLPKKMMKNKFPVYQFVNENNCNYIRKVAQTAAEKGINFYLEIKELWYRTYLLTTYPNLLEDGAICPNNDFWAGYLKEKLTALYEKIPEISGLIVSFATKESRLSVVNSRCQCEKCRQIPADDWFKKIIKNMYDSTKAAGKQLVIRDFAWSPRDLDNVVNAVETSPEDVIISLKNTPHDYYPNFPDNPRIGNVGNHTQWIEYDVWGQFYGWGVFPCVLLEDIKKRMQYALGKGAAGFIARTDWEGISEGTALDSLNKLNLYAAARLSKDIDTDFEDIYGEWLSHPVSTSFGASDVPSYRGVGEDEHEVGIDKLRSILQETWPVIEHGIFVRGFVFHFCCVFPEDLYTAWWMMEENQSLGDWAPEKESELKMTPENVRKIIEEKEWALKKVKELYHRLREDNNEMRLNPEFYKELLKTFRMFVVYIEGFYYTAKACVLTKYFTENSGEEHKKAAQNAVKDLVDYTVRLKEMNLRTKVHHYVFMLLDHTRLESLINDLNAKIV